jgi:hypothetical protein
LDSGFDSPTCEEKFSAMKQKLGDKGWAAYAECRKAGHEDEVFNGSTKELWDARKACLEKGKQAGK